MALESANSHAEIAKSASHRLEQAKTHEESQVRAFRNLLGFSKGHVGLRKLRLKRLKNYPGYVPVLADKNTPDVSPTHPVFTSV